MINSRTRTAEQSGRPLLVILAIGATAFLAYAAGSFAADLPARFWLLPALIVAPLVVSPFLRISVQAGWLVSIMIADLFLGDLDIGPASSRIYLVGLMATWLYVEVMVRKRRLFAGPLARTVTLVFASYVIWAALNDLFRGTGVFELGIILGSNELLGLVLFVLIQAVVTTRRDIIALAVAFVVSILATAAFALAQWLGYEWAWQIPALLRPETETRTFVRGLAFFSVSLSYQLLLGWGFALALLLWRPISRLSVVVLTVALPTLIALAIWVSLARSAVAAAFLVAALAMLWRFGLSQRGSGRTGVLLLAIAVPLIVAFARMRVTPRLVSPDEVGVGTGLYSLDRATDFDPANRVALAKYALISGLRYPVVGNVSGYIELAYPGGRPAESALPGKASAPHSYFFNALVRAGFPGMILAALFLLALIPLARRAIRVTSRDPTLRLIAAGAVLSIIGYTVNAQFHNASFLSGDIPPWWPVGLLAAMSSAALTARSDQKPAD